MDDEKGIEKPLQFKECGGGLQRCAMRWRRDGQAGSLSYGCPFAAKRIKNA
jgi:hypothetical protein